MNLYRLNTPAVGFSISQSFVYLCEINEPIKFILSILIVTGQSFSYPFSSFFGSQYSFHSSTSLEKDLMSFDHSFFMEGSSSFEYHSMFPSFSIPAAYGMSTSMPMSSPGILFQISQSFSYFESFDFFQSASFADEYSMMSSLSGFSAAVSLDLSVTKSYRFGESLPFEYSGGGFLYFSKFCLFV